MSSGSPPTFRHVFIDISHHFGYTLLRISLCKGRRSRGCSRLCGASAVPAGGTTHSVPGRLRASSGRHYDRSVGCATGLGQAGAGNARNNCVRCCLRKEDRYRSAFSPRPRKPGLKSRAAGESPQVRAAVERRQASASRRVRGRASCTAGWSKRLSAFRFPFLLPSVLKTQSRHCRHSRSRNGVTSFRL